MFTCRRLDLSVTGLSRSGGQRDDGIECVLPSALFARIDNCGAKVLFEAATSRPF
jgi:hypothetical protein